MHVARWRESWLDMSSLGGIERQRLFCLRKTTVLALTFGLLDVLWQSCSEWWKRMHQRLWIARLSFPASLASPCLQQKIQQNNAKAFPILRLTNSQSSSKLSEHQRQKTRATSLIWRLWNTWTHSLKSHESTFRKSTREVQPKQLTSLKKCSFSIPISDWLWRIVWNTQFSATCDVKKKSRSKEIRWRLNSRRKIWREIACGNWFWLSAATTRQMWSHRKPSNRQMSQCNRSDRRDQKSFDHW